MVLLHQSRTSIPIYSNEWINGKRRFQWTKPDWKEKKIKIKCFLSSLFTIFSIELIKNVAVVAVTGRNEASLIIQLINHNSASFAGLWWRAEYLNLACRASTFLDEIHFPHSSQYVSMYRHRTHEYHQSDGFPFHIYCRHRIITWRCVFSRFRKHFLAEDELSSVVQVCAFSQGMTTQAKSNNKWKGCHHVKFEFLIFFFFFRLPLNQQATEKWVGKI